MGNTYRKQTHKFDDEQYSGRSGRHAKHTNNHKWNGIPVIEGYDTTEIEDDFELESVESSINKE